MVNPLILAVNGGSSSLKFAVFSSDEPPSRLVWGVVERIGQGGSTLTVKNADGTHRRPRADRRPRPCLGRRQVVEACKRHAPGFVAAVGHRIVHGGPNYRQPTRITPEVIDELRRISPFDPDHLPSEIALIEEFQRRFPDVPHVACFDTAFHRTLPRVAYLLPIPRRYEAAGRAEVRLPRTFISILDDRTRQAGRRRRIARAE